MRNPTSTSRVILAISYSLSIGIVGSTRFYSVPLSLSVLLGFAPIGLGYLLFVSIPRNAWRSRRRDIEGFLVIAIPLACFIVSMAIWSLCRSCELRDFLLFGQLIIAITIPIFFAFWHLRTRPTETGTHCEHCDYNLAGNVSGKCPECGQKLSAYEMLHE